MKSNVRSMVAGWLLCGWTGVAAVSGQFTDPGADAQRLPAVPDGFSVTLFASEPLVRQPTSMAFDRQGRLFVGMGPQYRTPRPDSPGDQVVMILDTDGDGIAETVQVFAEGFNSIQGLAWVGNDLWIANAPDLTVVRDLDGDDVADQYVRLYTDLGNLEHGLHGLNVGPDGLVYMSKGNSKGLTEPGRVAPQPFRDLWGVTAPAGTPDFPPPQTFTRETYQRAYHDPDDDWGLDGGVLRCEPDGTNLEIVCRGFRNPWDITFDSGFNGLGTDNDQTGGDRVFTLIGGGHFGWNHPWSSHWSDAPHPPTAPVSGPLFEGSGTGVIYYDAELFPPAYRGLFFVNDWLSKTTYTWRPHWEGSLMRPDAAGWQPFVVGGDALYRPTDLEVGPDGALWILGWSRGYGVEWDADGKMTNEGRIFRIAPDPARVADAGAEHSPRQGELLWRSEARSDLSTWTVEALIDEFATPLPVWRTAAQAELLRRGRAVAGALVAKLVSGELSTARETWTAWTLGRIDPADAEITAHFINWISEEDAPRTSLNLRIQSVRILADRERRKQRAAPDVATGLAPAVLGLLSSDQPRLRMEASQALRVCRAVEGSAALLQAIEAETDATNLYVYWQTLRTLVSPAQLQRLLEDPRPAVQQAALLALLESSALTQRQVVQQSRRLADPARQIAQQWLENTGDGGPVLRGKSLDSIAHGSQRTGPETAATVRPAVAIATQAKAVTGRPVHIVAGGLGPGAKVYSDRDYILNKVPAEYLGADFLQTPNDDDGSSGADYLQFEVLLPAKLTIAFDTRNRSLPRWLRDGFEKEPQVIQADHWTFALYSREVAPGLIRLGGNTRDGRDGGKGSYIVLLQPLPLVERAAQTTWEEVMELVEQGDAARGQAWFLHPQGAGCVKCHSLTKNARALGPYLGDIGQRADVKHLVQSIVEPSAVITEGFQLQSVLTEDGKLFSGVLVEESGLSVTLGLATGEIVSIRKAAIEQRKSGGRSAMPDYQQLLSPQQVADLVAFLREAKTSAAGSVGPPAQSGSTAGQAPTEPAMHSLPEGQTHSFGRFEILASGDRWTLSTERGVLGEFVFGTAETPRPYFSNLHTPGGIRVTRPHPPVPGSGDEDHATMHPGLWIGFGDLSGHDFWRNRGRIEHLRLLDGPREEAGTLRWSTHSRLVGSDDQVLGSLVQHFAIRELKQAWVIDWEIVLHADAGELVLGDQEEMGFGARVATEITETRGGRIRNADGQETAGGTWGQASTWSDYSGDVGGNRVGVTLIPHPDNFRPSWWHNRDYGVFVANPFGRAAMKQGAPSAVRVAAGETLRLRLAAVLHEGAGFEPQEMVGKVWE
jgi:putative membrane-bound dehydrogenase-like protein